VLGPGITAYLVLSAILFATGIVGVLLRRSPLIVLLALELILNGGNLALIAFARQHGEGSGQIFALAVMVVAAAEVVIGLGLVVAMHRRKLQLDVDEMTTLRG
jgi:NADH-quinone oxidoreductase subunit K